MSSFNNKGFGLIEVIVATTLMGIATVSMMTMIENQTKAVAFMEDRLEKAEVERLVTETMASSIICSSLFGGNTITADKTTLYDIAELENFTGDVMYASNTNTRKLRVGQISFRNTSIDVVNSSGLVTLVIPVQRISDTGLKDFRSIEIDVLASVNNSFEITGCVSTTAQSIDPSGLGRDGWLCSCNGDYTSTTEGGTTICMLQVDGNVADIWVAPDPWTKATKANFTCANGTPPNPPGALPLLRWRYNNYSAVRDRCNMTAGAMTTATAPPCP